MPGSYRHASAQPGPFPVPMPTLSRFTLCCSASSWIHQGLQVSMIWRASAWLLPFLAGIYLWAGSNSTANDVRAYRSRALVKLSTTFACPFGHDRPRNNGFTAVPKERFQASLTTSLKIFCVIYMAHCAMTVGRSSDSYHREQLQTCRAGLTAL